MHELLLEVVLVGLYVRLSCKTSQPLLIDIQPEGTHPTQQHVHPKIKFELINEHRPLNVLLHNIVPSISDLLYFLHEENTLALTICFRFDNEGLFLLLAGNLFSQLAELRGQQPSFGKEIVVLGSSFVHVHETHA